MQIPKEIREKIEHRIKLNEELDAWFKKNLDVDGCDIRDVRIVDEPIGEPQGDGEYCDQTTLGEDLYTGQYYWKMDDGKYLCMYFDI